MITMSYTTYFGRLLLCICVFASYAPWIECTPSERRLLKHLFDDYDRRIRPAASDEEPVNVTLNMKIFQLIAVNEKEQSMEMSIWMRMAWKDHGLSWNTSEFNNIKEVHVSPKDVWLPDIVLYNNLHDDNADYGGNLDKLQNRVIVYSSGDVFRLTPFLVKARCAIDVKEFPFDTQHCHIKFGSWTYDKSQLDVQTTYGVEDSYPPHLGWNIIHAEGIRSEKEYGCCPNVLFPDISFHFHLQRRSLFYVLNLIFPIALITILTVCAFLLPDSSGERLSLGVTLMLATTVFMLLVAETTPESSDSVPVVTIYFMVCMIIMVVIIVILCVLSRLHHVKRYDKPMGHWTRKLIFDKLSYIMRIRLDRHQQREEVSTDTTNLKIDLNESPKMSKDDKGNTNEESQICTNFFLDGASVEGTDVGIRLKKIIETCGMKEEIIRELQSMAENRMEKKSLEERKVAGNYTLEEEWGIVVETVERCLFLFFALIFILMILCCFGGAQYTV